MPKKPKARHPERFSRLKIDRSVFGSIDLSEEGFDAETWAGQSVAKRFEHFFILRHLNHGQAALDPGPQGPLEIVEEERRRVPGRGRVRRHPPRLRE